MPTYSYRCTECGTAFDIHQAFTDDTLTVCPTCGGVLRKIFTPVGVTFSGSGFYRTDSRAKPDGGSGSSSGSDSGSSGSGSASSGASESGSSGSSSDSSGPSGATGASSTSTASSTPAPKGDSKGASKKSTTPKTH